jgi:hypothetical protein
MHAQNPQVCSHQKEKKNLCVPRSTHQRDGTQSRQTRIGQSAAGFACLLSHQLRSSFVNDVLRLRDRSVGGPTHTTAWGPLPGSGRLGIGRPLVCALDEVESRACMHVPPGMTTVADIGWGRGTAVSQVDQILRVICTERVLERERNDEEGGASCTHTRSLSLSVCL